jgi:hypothetical protein
MVVLTPKESAILTSLVTFTKLPSERRHELVDDLQSPGARAIGEIFLDESKYDGAPQDVKETVDHLRKWRDGNLRAGRARAKRRKQPEMRTPKRLVS